MCVFCSLFLVVPAILNDASTTADAFSPSRYAHRFSKLASQNVMRKSRVFLGATETTVVSTDETVYPSSIKTNVTLDFPSFYGLMDARPGGFVASETFACSAPSDGKESSPQHRFRVKLYPRGGGGESNGSPSASSKISEKLPPMLQSRSELVVGLYLQYLGCNEDHTTGIDTVNATFALRLKGQQRQQRFDVEWRAGMRFVSNTEDANLNQGDANDFGSPLMQTVLLKDFMGIVDSNGPQMYDEAAPVQVEAEIFIHDTALEESQLEPSGQKNSNTNQLQRSVSKGKGSPFNEDIRLREDGKTGAHDTERVRVGKIVVPVLSGLSQRPKMFEQGTYPGVEYRILRILKDGEERFTSCPGAEYELKPVYALVPQLERQWPVRVSEASIPKLYTPSMYNILSAFGSLFTAATGLFTAFLLSQAISLFFIPSKSMDPTLKVGDVLLVDKVSSRTIFRKNKVGDIVLFSPPSELQQIVAQSGGNLNSRDLFVKRIAAAPGDKVTVYKDGEVEVNDENVVDGRRDFCETEPLRLIEKYIQPTQEQRVNSDEVFVMGDCSSVSVDSRVWGSLKTENIVGRPIVRLWPLDRFGKVE